MSQRARALRLFASVGVSVVALVALLLAVAFSGPGTAVAAPDAQNPVTAVTVTWPTTTPAVYVKVGGTFTTSYSTYLLPTSCRRGEIG